MNAKYVIGVMLSSVISVVSLGDFSNDYAAVKLEIKNKQYATAIPLLQNMLNTYTNLSVSGNLAALLMDSYTRMERYDDAIDIATNHIPKNYSKQLDYTLKYKLVSCYVDKKEYDKVIAGSLVGSMPMEISVYRKLQKSILDQSIVLIKKKLRSEGKSFITVNGVNPVKPYITPVEESLNAAEWQGFETAYRYIGGDIADIDRSNVASNTAVLKEESLMGNIDPAKNEVKLLFGLGLTNYTSFVKSYNGL